MDVSHILEELNEAQREAVTAEKGHQLVLAGAGSGKTRVLVHRIAWLVEVMGASPHSVLAVTFTNKAASEMRGRAESLLGFPGRGMWVGTFHGLAHRLLRMHYKEAGLPESFRIIDSDDQLRLVKRIIKEMGLDDSRWPPRNAQWFINHCKDEGQRASAIDPGDDPMARKWQEIYAEYEHQCERAGLVDFAELLLRSHELWLKDAELLAHYQERFRHILVDEFQDTNAIQYAWIRVLAGDTGSVFVVGDDDQSIYGWRGAKVENVQQFTRDFPAVNIVRLEQNYRSTGTILNAANAIISHNSDRLGKKLWTEAGSGQDIDLYAAYNEQDEARYVVDRIEDWIDQGGSAQEVAVLYRSNAMSRLFEENLMSRRIPYRVYGGLRFFERAEIRDALAYLRLIANHDDDPAFERIVNVPARGIGDKTIDKIRAAAQSYDSTMWRATHQMLADNQLSPRAAGALRNFIALIEQLKEESATVELHELLDSALERSKLETQYDKEPADKAEARRENLAELVNAAQSFARPADDEEAGLSELDSFLSHAALEAGEGQAEDWESCVQLMSLHSAKGLEFPLVFMVGLEQGMFPHQKAVEEDGRLEEERRLCYVGITRARERLILSFAESRRMHGRESYNRPSRFLREIPKDLLNHIRPSVSATSVTGQSAPSDAGHADVQQDSGLDLGSRVMHKTYGEGVVTDAEGHGEHTRIHVNFDEAGPKILVLAYANLQVIA